MARILQAVIYHALITKCLSPKELKSLLVLLSVVGGRQYTYQVGFYGLKPLPNFFTKLMRYAFGPLIKTKKAITYFDDTLLQRKNKNEMFDTIRKYHSLLCEANLETATDKKKILLKSEVFLPRSIERRFFSNSFSPR